ncbi:MAG: hypothetical protein MZW92_06940 [Comamonadaceae bacterium]|nr:hypothetical protein [Comamonadaceae bacterium]
MSGVPVGTADFSTVADQASASPARVRTARLGRATCVQRRYARARLRSAAGRARSEPVHGRRLRAGPAGRHRRRAARLGSRAVRRRALSAMEVEALRAQSWACASSRGWRSTRTPCRRTVLASLFHTAYLYAHRLRDVDAAVIEVNPRHVPFYMRALNFELRRPRAPQRARRRAGGAAVRALLADPGRHRRSTPASPSCANTTRTLYPYGFSAARGRGHPEPPAQPGRASQRRAVGRLDQLARSPLSRRMTPLRPIAGDAPGRRAHSRCR